MAANRHVTKPCACCGAPFHPHYVGSKRQPQRFCSLRCGQLKRPDSLIVRFWSKVARRLGCWEWQAGVSTKGYGKFSVSPGHDIGAHRFMYQLLYGPIPNGLYVCHHCDNPRCVRPDHLFLGTNSDNILDGVRKGRAATGDRSGPRLYPERMIRGEQHHSAKLTATDIVSIRAQAAQGIRPARIAKAFNVAHSSIAKILYGRSWRHIP